MVRWYYARLFFILLDKLNEALLSTRVYFYGSASYTFQEENENYWEIKVYVGDTVECFEDTLRKNELLLCSIYQLQKDTNHSWYRIHPISTVKHTSEASFVHYCNSKCTANNHEPANFEYLQNSFLFSAI